jgi:hypothetical protein
MKAKHEVEDDTSRMTVQTAKRGLYTILLAIAGLIVFLLIVAFV